MYQHTVWYQNSHNYQDQKPPRSFYSLKDCLAQLEAWEGKGYISLSSDIFSPYAQIDGCGGNYRLLIGEDYGAGAVYIDDLIKFLVDTLPEKVKAAQGFTSEREAEFNAKMDKMLTRMEESVDKLAKEMGIEFK